MTRQPSFGTKHTQDQSPGSEKPSPQEAHDHMKDVVSRAIATAAGAVEGFADTMKRNDVPEKAKEAVEKLGEASRKIGIAGKEQFQQLKSDVGPSGQSSGMSGTEGAPIGQTGPGSTQSGLSDTGSQSGSSQTGSQSEPAIDQPGRPGRRSRRGSDEFTS